MHQVKRVLALAILVPLPAAAQVYATSGQNWMATFGFPSVSERSLVLQQAQIIHQMETADAQGPQSVYYVTNDNRSNYVQVETSGDVTTDYQIGDEIGQQTYAVGSLNTGSTTIDVTGEGNVITANNTADNSGCIDGSILSSSIGGGDVEGSVDLSALSALELADALARAGACQ